MNEISVQPPEPIQAFVPYPRQGRKPAWHRYLKAAIQAHNRRDEEGFHAAAVGLDAFGCPKTVRRQFFRLAHSLSQPIRVPVVKPSRIDPSLDLSKLPRTLRRKLGSNRKTPGGAITHRIPVKNEAGDAVAEVAYHATKGWRYSRIHLGAPVADVGLKEKATPTHRYAETKTIRAYLKSGNVPGSVRRARAFYDAMIHA